MMDRSIIEAYATGSSALDPVVAGLTEQELDAHPVPGTWSIRQIVLHLMDSDLIGSYRMKRVIAMDRPCLEAYDETLFASRLAYEGQDASCAADMFRLNRQMMASVLRVLPGDAFSRVGVHEERGELTLGSLVATYVEHLEHHLQFARRKRAMLDKPT